MNSVIYLGFFLVQLFYLPNYALAKTVDEAAATIAWEQQDYKEFLRRSVIVEKKKSSFATSFNVALGQFRTSNFQAAKKKIADIRKRSDLTAANIQLLASLEAEVKDNESKSKKLSERYTVSGGGILSKPGYRLPNTKCQGENRYKQECQSEARTVEERERLIQTLNGQRIPNEFSSVKPETTDLQ